MVERSLPNFEMSAPDTKALPPARVSPTTRISLSAAKPLRISVVASHISSDTALCRSGLLKVTMPTPPSLRESILSVWLMVTSLFIRDGRLVPAIHVFLASSRHARHKAGHDDWLLHRIRLMQRGNGARGKAEFFQYSIG